MRSSKPAEANISRCSQPTQRPAHPKGTHLCPEGEPLLYVGQRALQHGLQRGHRIAAPTQLLLQHLEIRECMYIQVKHIYCVVRDKRKSMLSVNRRADPAVPLAPGH